MFILSSATGWSRRFWWNEVSVQLQPPRSSLWFSVAKWSWLLEEYESNRLHSYPVFLGVMRGRAGQKVVSLILGSSSRHVLKFLWAKCWTPCCPDVSVQRIKDVFFQFYSELSRLRIKEAHEGEVHLNTDKIMSVVKKLLVWPTDLDLSSYFLATKRVTVTFNTFANVVVKL